MIYFINFLVPFHYSVYIPSDILTLLIPEVHGAKKVIFR